MSRVRLSVVMTHPIQYYSPWFRYIAENCGDIDLKVHYCVIPTPEQQGVGFEQPFIWDSSLLEGYDHVILRKPSKDVKIHSSFFFGVTVPEIAVSVIRAKPDVVLVPGWYSVSLVTAALAARAAGLPVFYRGDSLIPAGSRPESPTRRARTKAVLGLFTQYLTVGVRNHEYLRSYSLPESRIFFSPLCVDNAFFSATAALVDRDAERRQLNLEPDDFVVLFAGKLEENKRPWDVIEAAGLAGNGVKVLISGSGDAEAQCRQTASRLGADVRFLGFRNQKELARLYRLADCLALPSQAEPWGLVVNEALSTGLPCVVSDRVGCGPDLIEDGKTGYVVPHANPQELATALTRIRDAVNAGNGFADACVARADAYSFRTATEGLRAAIESALERPFRQKSTIPATAGQ